MIGSGSETLQFQASTSGHDVHAHFTYGGFNIAYTGWVGEAEGRRRGGGGGLFPLLPCGCCPLLQAVPPSILLLSPTHLSLLARFHFFCLYPHYTITTTRPDLNITCFANRREDEEARHRGVMVHGYRIVTMSLFIPVFSQCSSRYSFPRVPRRCLLFFQHLVIRLGIPSLVRIRRSELGSYAVPVGMRSIAQHTTYRQRFAVRVLLGW